METWRGLGDSREAHAQTHSPTGTQAASVEPQTHWTVIIRGAWTVDDGPGTRGVDTPASPFLGSHSQAPEAGGAQP